MSNTPDFPDDPMAEILPGFIAYLFAEHHDPYSIDRLAWMSYDELNRLRAQAVEDENDVLIKRIDWLNSQPRW